MNHQQRRLMFGLFTFLLLPPLIFAVLHSQSQPIVQVAPRPGSAEVWLGTAVQVTFAVPMDHASVESHFVVEPATSGSFIWWSWDRGETVEFRPDDLLAPTTAYRVTLQAGLRDAAGQVVLNSDYWNSPCRPKAIGCPSA